MARIISEKFVKEGCTMRRIVSFVGIEEEQALPNEYLQSQDTFYLSDVENTRPHITLGTGHSVHPSVWYGFPVTEGKECQTVYEGDEMTEEEFQKLMIFLRQCGERLGQIRRKNVWSGIMTFTMPYSGDIKFAPRIHWDKIWKDDTKWVRIIGWDNIPITANLPTAYLAGNKSFFLQSSGEPEYTAIVLPGTGQSIKIGDEFPLSLWEQGKTYLSECTRELLRIEKREIKEVCDNVI
jgi:hypothetical protein